MGARFLSGRPSSPCPTAPSCVRGLARLQGSQGPVGMSPPVRLFGRLSSSSPAPTFLVPHSAPGAPPALAKYIPFMFYTPIPVQNSMIEMSWGVNAPLAFCTYYEFARAIHNALLLYVRWRNLGTGFCALAHYDSSLFFFFPLSFPLLDLCSLTMLVWYCVRPGSSVDSDSRDSPSVHGT